MRSIESHHHSSIVLLGIAGAYAFVNLVGVALAAHGVFHPPWGILMFFTWFGPADLALGLLSFQLASRRRFSWLAAAVFLLACVAASLINLHIYGLALAAV